MADVVDQQSHLIAVETPLGENAVVLTSFEGEECLSTLFCYKLEMFSSNINIDSQELLGKNITFQIKDKDNNVRYFNGFVSKFYKSQMQLKYGRQYKAEIVPWTWFLTQSTNYKIFQDKTIVQILEEIFKDFGFSYYEISGLKNQYTPRTYCVQYGESAFNFISRLMEEEGIFYFFSHEKGKHTLILADQTNAFLDFTSNEVIYRHSTSPSRYLQKWDRRYAFGVGKYSHSDYNFEAANMNLFTATNTLLPYPDFKKYEVYEFPGLYADSSTGNALAKIRIEEQESLYDEVFGEGGYSYFSPGVKFTLKEHIASEEQGDYLITSVKHQARAHAHIAGYTDEEKYNNAFQCVPASSPLRPSRITMKPRVHGLQMAVVVGPEGEEIYTDQYGRVKVQFMWDREGQKNEKSSCWIRVLQPWAGNKWGAIFTPRIGQEVMIDFIGGDPDMPVVVGGVYNSMQMPPYELPSQKTKSGIKTHSSKEGGLNDANELRFEDENGKEEVYFHAQKDFNRIVENDDTLNVKHDQTITILNNRTETVEEGNENITIEKGDRNIKVSMGNDTLNVSTGNQAIKVDLGKSSIEAMQAIELTVGQNSIKIDQTGINIKGLMVNINGTMIKIEADAMLQLQGALTKIN